MKKSIIFLLTTSILLFFYTSLAGAVVSPTINAQETIQKRCNLVTSRINLIINRYENNKQRHIEKYQRIKERLKGVNKILKSRGCDTSQTELDYQKLDTMIIDFAKEYNDFITMLKATQNYVCGQSQGDYLKSLNQARKQLLVVKQKSLNIRNFYQSTIRQDLLQLKEKCGTVLTPTNTQ